MDALTFNVHVYILIKEDKNVITLPPKSSEILSGDENDPVALPPFNRTGVINRGPEKMVTLYFNVTNNKGRFETIIQQDIMISHDGVATIIDVPQKPIYQWEVVINNNTDMISNITMQA